MACAEACRSQGLQHALVCVQVQKGTWPVHRTAQNELRWHWNQHTWHSNATIVKSGWLCRQTIFLVEVRVFVVTGAAVCAAYIDSLGTYGIWRILLLDC